MQRIVKRICRIMALVIIYIISAFGYLTMKGFTFDFLSNPAMAKETSFSQKIQGDVTVSQNLIRTIGDEKAPLTLYEISSMSCIHCRDFHQYTLPKLERDFVSTGKLKITFIHFPVEVIVMRAAKLSYCLPEDKFFSFLDKLYSKKDWLFAETEDKLYDYAKEFGMTTADIEKCNEDKKLTSDIMMTRDSIAEKFGINVTPSFIIEGTDGQELISGAKDYSDMKKYLQKRLDGDK